MLKREANSGRRNVLVDSQERYDHMLVRRSILRGLLEKNYGKSVSKKKYGEMLETVGYGCSAPTLAADFKALGVQEITAVLGGRRIKFYAIAGYIADHAEDNLKSYVPQNIIENETYKALTHHVVDVFQDGKRIIILTHFELGRHVAMWLRNLQWPEIWYFAKYDGDTIIIETRSEERAAFLRKRLWGFRTELSSLTKRIARYKYGSDGKVIDATDELEGSED